MKPYFLTVASLICLLSIIIGCAAAKPAGASAVAKVENPPRTWITNEGGVYFRHRAAVHIPGSGVEYAEVWRRIGDDFFYVRSGTGKFSVYPRSMVASDEEIAETLAGK